MPSMLDLHIDSSLMAEYCISQVWRHFHSKTGIFPVSGVERMTGKMPVLLSLAAADEVTYWRRLQMRQAEILDRIYETEH